MPKAYPPPPPRAGVTDASVKPPGGSWQSPDDSALTAINCNIGSAIYITGIMSQSKLLHQAQVYFMVRHRMSSHDLKIKRGRYTIQ